MTSPFDGLRPPRPAPQLRARVLLAAAGAAPERPHWIDLLWESRRARLALALGLVLALAVNLRAASQAGAQRPAPHTVEVEGLLILAERLESPQSAVSEEIR